MFETAKASLYWPAVLFSKTSRLWCLFLLASILRDESQGIQEHVYVFSAFVAETAAPHHRNYLVLLGIAVTSNANVQLKHTSLVNFTTPLCCEAGEIDFFLGEFHLLHVPFVFIPTLELFFVL